MLCLSAELEPVKFPTKDQRKDAMKLIDQDFKPSKGKDKWFEFEKLYYLIYSYMKGKPIGKSLRNDLLYIQRKCLILFDTFSDSVLRGVTVGYYFRDQNDKDRKILLNFACYEQFVKFVQCFYQGLYVDNNS